MLLSLDGCSEKHIKAHVEVKAKARPQQKTSATYPMADTETTTNKRKKHKNKKDHEEPNTNVRQHTSRPLCMVAEPSEFHREKLEVFRVVAKTDLVHTELVVFDTDQKDGSGLRIEPDGNHEEWTWNAGAAVWWQRQPQEEPGHKNKETEIPSQAATRRYSTARTRISVALSCRRSAVARSRRKMAWCGKTVVLERCGNTKAMLKLITGSGSDPLVAQVEERSRIRKILR